MTLIAALLVGSGLAIMVVSLLGRSARRHNALLDLLDLPLDDQELDLDEVVQRVGLLRPSAAAMDDVLQRLNLTERIATNLERGRVALKPGEWLIVVALIGIVVGLWSALITGVPWIGAVVALMVIPASRLWLTRRVEKRRRDFEEQLPGALQLIAGSLAAGHTLLRSITLMVEQSQAPMSEELERVVAETRLGTPVVDALQHLSERVGLRDLEWVVHAIRVQSTTGGRLADLLHTLADYMMARAEVRREIDVLTAEGRLSAYVLGGLPIFMLIYLQLVRPEYIAEMWTPTGILLLLLAGAMIAGGIYVIMKMVKSVDL